MRRVLGHLSAVVLATILAGAVIGGAGDLIVFGGVDLPQRAAQPSAVPTTRGDAAAGFAPSAVAAAEPTAAATTTPTPPRLTIAPYRSGGRSYVGITTRDDTASFEAPFAGTVEVRTYQLIDGEVRVGSSVPTLPFFPYISVVANDRKVTFRPGALGITELIAKDGTAVATGDPLFRLSGRARSSWATFYDAKAEFQIVVSLQSVPGNRDLDAAPLFAAN